MATAGRVLMIPAGEWKSGSNYGMLDVVVNAGSSYVAKKNINNSTVAPPNDGEGWQLLAQGYDVTNIVTKNMMTGQNVNDANKVPNSALMYAVKQQVDQQNSDIEAINAAIPVSNDVINISAIAKNISEGTTGDAFSWITVPVNGTYLLTVNIKQYETSAADIQVILNDNANPSRSSSDNVMAVIMTLQKGDVVKVKLKSTKGRYDVYADQRYFSAGLICLK